jgi:hypothetical protein
VRRPTPRLRVVASRLFDGGGHARHAMRRLLARFLLARSRRSARGRASKAALARPRCIARRDVVSSHRPARRRSALVSLPSASVQRAANARPTRRDHGMQSSRVGTRFARRCAGCGEPLSGACFGALGVKWHQATNAAHPKCTHTHARTHAHTHARAPSGSRSRTPARAMARAPTRRTERCSAADRATPQGCFKCAHCGVQLKKFYELDDKAYCQQACSEDRNKRAVVCGFRGTRNASMVCQYGMNTRLGAEAAQGAGGGGGGASELAMRIRPPTTATVIHYRGHRKDAKKAVR